MDIKDGSFICKPLHPRQQGMEYYVDHRDDQFYIITNADGKNYRVSIHTSTQKNAVIIKNNFCNTNELIWSLAC